MNQLLFRIQLLGINKLKKIIIIIIDKTDAGLNGLCIRDITLIYDVINTYNTTRLYCGSRCHGDLFCNHTILLDLTKTYPNGF